MKKPTKERIVLLRSGNVFDGLEDIQNEFEKRRVMISRHCQLMDLDRHNLLPKHLAPEKWAEEFMKMNEKKRALKVLEDILKSLVPEGEPHVLNIPFYKMEGVKKDIEFYTIARNWIKNHAS